MAASACSRTRAVRELMTRLITKSTIKVMTYCVSLTAKVRYGGTRKKTNANNPANAESNEGPRPRKTAEMTVETRYNITRLVGSSSPRIKKPNKAVRNTK